MSDITTIQEKTAWVTKDLRRLAYMAPTRAIDAVTLGFKAVQFVTFKPTEGNDVDTLSGRFNVEGYDEAQPERWFWLPRSMALCRGQGVRSFGIIQAPGTLRSWQYGYEFSVDYSPAGERVKSDLIKASFAGVTVTLLGDHLGELAEAMAQQSVHRIYMPNFTAQEWELRPRFFCRVLQAVVENPRQETPSFDDYSDEDSD